jgi:cephalosporin-C deacetylase-like acetyl esterase
MAGNVKEWTWNSSGERRMILGGGWNEPSYMFQDPDAQDAFARGGNYGFRCAQYPEPPAPEMLAPIPRENQDYRKPAPADDKTFETFRRIYSYDKTPLETRLEATDDSSEYWRREKVSFRAVYGNERLIGYLYLPRNSKRPFQTVIYAPGGYAHGLSSSETGIRTSEFSYLLETGRAVFHPVFKTTYERRIAGDAGPIARRDATVQYIKDVFQSMDFLESRPDIDAGRIAYHGLSSGTWHGIFALALENRLKTAVLSGGGLVADINPPELELVNFAPRIKLPVMMVNGKHDFAYPLEASQKPLFRLLGTREPDKRHALFEGGHVPPVQETMREVLAWLDRYLGPVK